MLVKIICGRKPFLEEGFSLCFSCLNLCNLFLFFAPSYLTSAVFLSSLVLTLSSYFVQSFSHLIDFILLSAVVLHPVVVVAAAEDRGC